MSSAFWSNAPWASGNGHYGMNLQPTSESNWCARGATSEEQKVKRSLLQDHYPVVLQSIEGSEHAQQLLASEIEKRLPLTLINDATDRLPLPDTAKASLPLIASALTVPEDLCLLKRDNTNNDNYSLVAACVCAPSYWHLPAKIGLGLHEVHAAVPGLNEALGSRIQQFFLKLPRDRVFVRRNWFLHQSAERFQPHPEERSELNTAAEAEALVVRTETQMLKRLSPDVIVFSIGIDCYPLVDLRAYPESARALRTTLLSKTKLEQEAAGQAMYETAVLALIDDILKG